jgi:membrane-bound inhibitor of C-type lysozyme
MKLIKGLKMNQFLFILFLIVGLQACTPETRVEDDAEIQSDSAELYTQVLFECVDNLPVTVRFYKRSERAVMIRNNDEIELKQIPTASGFSYTNGPYSIRGKGDDLVLNIGRMSGINCLAM